ncbi:1-acyl-sn-glycerol-3-phosphate acyltransferases [Modicisalibacter muralis]|uniref:1-acyl-sn-glycerol-3-phosphate acyltransferases n=1 Tax=Modicisalibacter muralis TaxID=119000 RepID=A0A1G9Q9S0_9GAMM|nr:MFS transporter [Halomonas muralis]SDM07481.1 1-acyl-sn-glycerol-3-phosphate acyltransferases [Halomonas muralis]
MLAQRRFAPFFWTQALGAFNDNVFKNVLLLLLTFVAVPRYGWDTGLLNNLAAGLFILPFLLFSAWGGTLADRLDKRYLIRRLKLLELATMSVAALAVWFEQFGLLLALLFMMGTQSALFGPVKYAILPQHLAATELVRGNAWVNMGTFVSILLGTLLAGLLAALDGAASRGAIAATLIGVALLGYLVSLGVPAAPSSDPGRVSWQPLAGSMRVMHDAWRHPRVFRGLLGISLFWFLGACYLTQLPAWVRDVVNGGEAAVSFLLGAFALGVGGGALLCARLSAGRLEVGLVPLGALLISAAGLDLALQPDIVGERLTLGALVAIPGFWHMALDLALVGVGGGLYSVPLYTLVQVASRDDHRARMIAANNLLNALFMVIAAGFGIVMLTLIGTSLHAFFVCLAVIPLLVGVGILTANPRSVLRLALFALMHVLYRLRFSGRSHIPTEGAALVVCNHVSFMDALILGGACPRPLRFLMDRPIYESPWLNWFFRIAGAIPVDSERRDPGGVRRALGEVSRALRDGEVVMLFPEGRLTTDGEVGRFRRGVDMILARDAVPVVPAALAGLWGSWTSHCGGKALSKRPRRFRARVRLVFGAPLSPRQAGRTTLEARVRELKVAADDWAKRPVIAG